MPQQKTSIGRLLLGLCSLLLLSFLLLAYPLYVIRPFRFQGVHELTLALVVLRIRLVLQLGLIAGALLLCILVWRRALRRWPKAIASAATLLIIGFAALSRVNVYELMFHPMDTPAFSAASSSALDGREQVIAVRVGAVARAYPIRSMSYHHIVNDVVAGLPIVATY